MKAVNTIKIQFPSKSINEAFARSAISSFAAQMDPTLEEIADLKTAVSEAVTNCIVHAYQDTIGTITITGSIYENNVLKIVIADKGIGIENIEKAMQPMFTTGGPERAGLGFAVMESFTDKIKVFSRIGKGTRITMTKQMGTR